MKLTVTSTRVVEQRFNYLVLFHDQPDALFVYESNAYQYITMLTTRPNYPFNHDDFRVEQVIA